MITNLKTRRYLKHCVSLLEKYSKINKEGFNEGLGNSYSSRRYLYSSIRKANDRHPLIVESISYEVPQEEAGGIIVISTDINSKNLNKNKLVNWIHQKIKTLGNRLTYNKKVVDRLKTDERVGGWTIGRFLKGRYVGDNGQVFDENSFSIEIIGISIDNLLDIAEDICKDFDQETVLVKTYYPQRILFVDSEKRKVDEAIMKDIKKGVKKNMKLKEDINVSYLYDVFSDINFARDDIMALAEDLLDRASGYGSGDAEEDIDRALDDGLIYEEDQWAILHYYQTPETADFDSAIEQFRKDLITAYTNSIDEEDDLEDVDEDFDTEDDGCDCGCEDSFSFTECDKKSKLECMREGFDKTYFRKNELSRKKN